jgi:hypothetical protein
MEHVRSLERKRGYRQKVGSILAVHPIKIGRVSEILVISVKNPSKRFGQARFIKTFRKITYNILFAKDVT